MKKLLSITLTITCAIWMTSLAAIPFAGAATIVEGDIVSPDAEYVDADGNTYYPYDVFIIKYMGGKSFKRLVLNPEVFDSYGHLEWANIKTVTVAELEAFSTADAVRADGDEKVYKLFPNGDSGTKRWVEDLDCFNTNSYDWDSVYVINSVDRDNYTTGSSMCGGGDVATGDLTMSLASDNPAASTHQTNSQGVTFLSVNITGSGTVNQLTFKRLGAGDTGDFGDLYIYKNGVRLTSGRALSSATSKVTFINLGLVAPTTFQLVADMSTATAGDINYFSIEDSSDVTGTVAVGGSFPLTGNPMGVSGTAGGTVTVTRSGAGSRNVTIGATEVEISQFKIAVATEGANVNWVELFNNGTADNAKITNLKLKDNTGVTVATATAIGDDGYVTFVFDPPYYIKKSDSEIFRVYADIGAVKPDRTILLYTELATSVLAKGTTYGFGMAATVTSFDGSSSTEYVTVTCKGGDLTLNKIGPNATGIGTKTDDTVFLEYSISAAADITIKRTELIFCHDDSGNGTYANASSSAGADITDIKIVDKDTGTVIVGPKDGTAFNDGTRSTSCPGSKAGMYEAFTDTIDLTTGNTYTYQVTADIDITATDSGMELTATDIVKFILYSYSTMVGTSGTVNYVKYAGTSDAVDDSAIIPSGDIAGEEMTLQAASLALSLAATPSGRDADSNEKVYIAGQSGVNAVGLIFTAGAASDITINSIQTTAYIMEGTGTSFTAGREATNDYVKDTVANIYIYDNTNGGLVPGSTAKGFTSGDSFENTDFNGLSWTIPAGESYTMMVVVDISSAAPASASTADTWISFDIAAAADVSAVDNDGNSVTMTGHTANGTTSPNTDFGVADYGTLVIDQASDTPDKSIVVMGSSDNEVSKFKLTGTYESWNIEKFSIALDDGGGIDTEDRDNFTAVKIKYQTESQWDTDNWTITSGKTFGATASLAFSFSGDSRIFVPKDDDSFVTVLTSIASYNGGNGGKSKKAFKMYDTSGSTSSFKAYGGQSGKQLITPTTDSAAAADFNLHFVARSKPVFAKVAWAGGETELARFSITAVGGDIIFKNTDFDFAGSTGGYYDGGTTPASAYLEFDVIASGTLNASTSFYLYDWTETIVSSAINAGVYDPATTEFNSNNNANVATIGFHFEEGNYTKTIPNGETKEFHINIDGADITDFDNSDEYIYLKLTGDEGGNLATGSADARIIIYDDDTTEEGISAGGEPEERFMVPGDIKNIGPLPLTFRTLRGTVAP